VSYRQADRQNQRCFSALSSIKAVSEEKEFGLGFETDIACTACSGAEIEQSLADISADFDKITRLPAEDFFYQFPLSTNSQVRKAFAFKLRPETYHGFFPAIRQKREPCCARL